MMFSTGVAIFLPVCVWVYVVCVCVCVCVCVVLCVVLCVFELVEGENGRCVTLCTLSVPIF